MKKTSAATIINLHFILTLNRFDLNGGSFASTLQKFCIKTLQFLAKLKKNINPKKFSKKNIKTVNRSKSKPNFKSSTQFRRTSVPMPRMQMVE
jgi:hypothetical protein